jgi:hypothetical protein
MVRHCHGSVRGVHLDLAARFHVLVLLRLRSKFGDLDLGAW